MTNQRVVQVTSQKSTRDELAQRDSVSSLSLRTVSEMHEQMKEIVKGSNRLYIISLNAMFASRTTKNDATGFVEVTALLRDFSHRLDNHVTEITDKINNLVFQSAAVIKKQKLNALLHQAVAMSDNIAIPENFISNHELIYREINHIYTDLLRLLGRCEKLMQIGENLTVLAKVEAVAGDDGGSTLTPITVDMTDAINHIGECLAESQQIIAA